MIIKKINSGLEELLCSLKNKVQNYKVEIQKVILDMQSLEADYLCTIF